MLRASDKTCVYNAANCNANFKYVERVMKFIRWFLGRVILLLNFVFSPRGVKRSQEEQSKVNE
ncbi:glutaredoxin, partial [Vibrio breoganii]